MSETNIYQYELKIQALTERIGELTQQYENRVADLRVDLTMKSQEAKQISQEVIDLKAMVKQMQEDLGSEGPQEPTEIPDISTLVDVTGRDEG